ncbi:hypothetical protein AGDE_02680 [Angomonas deanei]|uniref:Uncharacterized protein n=1 Tax=Angomonas deanei TaxID=59799 RepID=A0A7G2C8U2_9TRYP|nr:hypothetical protein AGDE_02680 [Angomonas deanei]CAD2215267.1 hypothetical protein, conserved [Angomonas deanei]|eukprot:EPY41245.1 hypothetical protein AGDE_02680 [Angomonas deanei]
MSHDIKEEPKVDEMTRATVGSMDYYNPIDEEEDTGAIYYCANCTGTVRLASRGELQCPSCQHLTGSSTVFYKIRTVPTTYDTI